MHTHLITGGAGNLACQLTFKLVADGSKIVLLDIADQPAGEIAPGCEYVRCDLTDTTKLNAQLDRVRPTSILHFASLLSGSCETNRALAWRVNIDATFALFEMAIARGIKKFFVPSSVATYGGEIPSPMPEDFPQWPGGLYGVTKVAVERLGVYYHAKHGLDFRGLRLPVVISRHAPSGAASAYASRAFIDAVKEKQFVFRVRPQTRPATLYVDDVLDGIVALLAAPSEKLTRRVYNIGGLSFSASDLRDAIAARIPDANLSFEPDPTVADLIESWPTEIDDSSARRDWGWSPTFDLNRLADDFIQNLQSE